MRKLSIRYGIGITLVMFLFIVGRDKVFSLEKNKEVGAKNYKINLRGGQVISLEAKGADFFVLLRDLAVRTGIALRFGSTRDTKVNLSLNNLSVEEAIKKIIKAGAGSYVMMYSNTTHDLKEVMVYWKSVYVGDNNATRKLLQRGTFSTPKPLEEEIKIDEKSKIVVIDSTPKNPEREAISNYIQQRHALLEELSNKNPNLIVESQLSLRDFLSTDEVRKLLDKYPTLKVRFVNYGSEDFSRAYPVEGGTIDEKLTQKILTNYKDTAKFFEGQGEKPGDAGIDMEREELMKTLSMINSQKDSIKKEGLRIYGVTIEGRIKDMEDIKNDQRIRLLDPKWHENKKQYESSGYKVKILPLSIPPMF